ncbi:MAG: hypothetical protein ABI359_02355 [Ginsengibacter sp.]
MLDLRSDEEKNFYDFIDNTNDNGIRKIDRHTQLYPTENILTEQFNNDRELKLKDLVSSFKIEIENNLCKSGIDKTAFLNRHSQKATKYKNQWVEIANRFSDTTIGLDSTKPYIMQNVVSLLMVVQFLEENLMEDNIPELPINSYFNLLTNIDTESCYNVLKGNFINENTTKKNFNSLFDKKGVTEKISWKGSLPELARFIFLLHSDYLKDNHKLVCSEGQHKYKTASICFTHKGKDIDADRLEKNNRLIENKERSRLLYKALKHLQKPIPTTSK